MAEWDFESALKDYFGASTEDGDAPLGAGSATFSAPSGWDFDKALNDYFGGVNGYIAPRGYESPEGWTPRNAPWEFSPPNEPPPPPSDYDQAVWFNALQRRHEAWDQAREQQELLRAPTGYIAPRGYEFPNVGGVSAREDFGLRHRGFVPPPLAPMPMPTPTLTPPARGVTPEDFGLRHRGFVPPPPPPTPTITPMPTSTPTPTPSMPGQQPAQAQGGFEAWLDKFNDISKLLASLPGRLGDIARPGGWRRPVTLPSQADITGWLTEFIPTEEEIQAIEGRKGGAFPYLGRQAGRLIGAVGRSNELARQYVPGVGGEEDLPLYVPLGIPYDPTEDLKANYPGIEPSVYPMLAQMHTTVRPQWLMPPPYGQEGTRASGFALPEPFNSITLAAELGKRPDPSNVLHELAHQMSYREFGGIAPSWEGTGRDFQQRFSPGWDPFINAVNNYKGNPSPQYAAVNNELTNRTSYLKTNPMEAYAEIARLSQGDLGKMPPEFRKFYTWLNYYKPYPRSGPQ